MKDSLQRFDMFVVFDKCCLLKVFTEFS